MAQYNSEFYSEYGGMQYWAARRFYAKLVKRYGKSGRLLEVGCGLGHVLMYLEDTFETHGFDVSDYAIQQARKNAPRSDLRVAPVEALEALPGPYDAIIAFHVVEHLEDPGATLRRCAEITSPGGLLVIATPNTEAPFAERKGERWYARTDPTHVSLKPPHEWLELVRGAGYRVVRTLGDGLWDVPYVPLIPNAVQLAFFAFPAAVQAFTGLPFIPVRFGESLILIAERVRS